MAKKKTSHSILDKKQSTSTTTPVPQVKVFQRINYLIMLIGAVTVVIGYILMIGGEQPRNEFVYEEIYSFRRITLSPILIVIGFIIITFGILWNPGSSPNSTGTSPTTTKES